MPSVRDDLDDIDFKPFFDVMVGVLFVLLILVATLLFFQTAQQEAESQQSSRQNFVARQIELKTFLELVARDLSDRHIDARVDLPNGAVIVPLDAVARLGADGLPEIVEGQGEAVSAVLARDLSCVASSSQRSASCPQFRLLRLDHATALVRIGTLAPRAKLPMERFAHLLASQLEAALFRKTPNLLALSNTSGRSLFVTSSAVGNPSASTDKDFGGDLEIGFVFEPPS